MDSINYGMAKITPILPSIIVFGLIFGLTGALSGLSLVLTSSMSYVIFAGSAQFIVLLLINQGELLGSIILAAIIINLRHLLFGAALKDDLHSHGLRRLLLAYLLTDEAFLITTISKKDLENNVVDDLDLDSVLFGSGILLWIVWNITTIVGHSLTSTLQFLDVVSPDFIVAVTFLGYLVMIKFVYTNSSPRHVVVYRRISVVYYQYLLPDNITASVFFHSLSSG